MIQFKRMLSTVVVVTSVATLAACAAPGQPMQSSGPTAYPRSASVPAAPSYGRVTNVEYVRGGQSQGVAGAVIGGGLGGVVGNQIGSGSGRTLATVAGVVGGALIGRRVQQNMDTSQSGHYRVTVQLDDGAMRSFDYVDPPSVQVGDRVRLDGEELYR